MDKKIITFDLETIADKSVIPIIDSIFPIKPDSRIKDPAKIEADIEKKNQEKLQKLGLNPMTARICCFGWHDGEAGKAYHYILEAETPEAEKRLLQKAWEILAEGDHFVTKNGNEFDVPMLRMRSLINHVRPAINIATKKYTIQNHTDIQAVLNNWKPFQKGTLEDYGQLILKKSVKENLSGDMIQDAWDMELYEDISKYCESDCEATYQIFELMQKYYL